MGVPIRLPLLALLVAAALAMLPAGAARADAIDGDWCLGSQSMNINGPNIRTPAGNQTTGDYTRHTFSYTIPKGEPGEDGRLNMRLLNDDMLEVSRPRAGSGSASPPEIWRRCKPTS